MKRSNRFNGQKLLMQSPDIGKTGVEQYTRQKLHVWHVTCFILIIRTKHLRLKKKTMVEFNKNRFTIRVIFAMREITKEIATINYIYILNGSSITPFLLLFRITLSSNKNST